MARVTFDITDESHDDHMPAATLAAILKIAQAGEAQVVVPPQAGIFIAKVEIPSGLPDLLNALRGPASGEESVAESDVFYGVRGGRPCLSRLSRQPSTPTRFATVIVGNLTKREDGSFKGDLFTAFGDNPPSEFGVIAPQEPGDKFAPVETLGERVEFWQQHALSSDSPMPIREAVATFADFADPERSQFYADAVNKRPEGEE